MRRKIHSLTFVFMALLMMLMTFASCSKIQDLLNEGDDDDGINPPELVEEVRWLTPIKDVLKPSLRRYIALYILLTTLDFARTAEAVRPLSG